MSRIWDNHDVVDLVADLLEDSVLYTLCLVHRAFYDRWLSRRYRELIIEERSKATRVLLQGIANGSKNIGPFVRQLCITPWPVAPHTKSPRSRTEALLTRAFLVVDPDYTKKQAEFKLQKKLAKDGGRITAAMRAMVGVNAFQIVWDESQAYHAELFQAALIPLTSPDESFNSWKNLRRLSLKLPPALLNSMASVHLPYLEDLEYTFATGNMKAADIKHAHSGFLVFLNNLCPTLERFSIVSTPGSLDLDMSWFFRILASERTGPFRRLHAISLSIPFDGQQLTEPEQFVRFLDKHRSRVKDILITTTRSGPRSTPGKPGCADNIQRILEGLSAGTYGANRLRTLVISMPTHLPLETLFRVLRDHASTLEHVGLYGRTYSGSDVANVVRVLSMGGQSALTKLSLRMSDFDILLPSLVNTLPTLREVTLDYSSIGWSAIAQTLPNASLLLHGSAMSLATWSLERLHIGPFDLHGHIGATLATIMPNLHVFPLISGA